MRRFLFVVLLIVAGITGLAFYLGWVGFTTDSASGTFNITFMVHKDKIQEDQQKALEKVRSTEHPAHD